MDFEFKENIDRSPKACPMCGKLHVPLRAAPSLKGNTLCKTCILAEFGVETISLLLWCIAMVEDDERFREAMRA